MFTKTLITTLAASVSVATSPAPSKTTASSATKIVKLTGITHFVDAGINGTMRFEPDNVVAEIGDIVEWHFSPKNHSVAQSTFGEPCVPDAEKSHALFSGFQHVPANKKHAPKVFQVVIEDDSNPIWYYCAQTVGSHCQHGMVGVINQDFMAWDETLEKYRKLAADTDRSMAPTYVQGGALIPDTWAS